MSPQPETTAATGTTPAAAPAQTTTPSTTPAPAAAIEKPAAAPTTPASDSKPATPPASSEPAKTEPASTAKPVEGEKPPTTTKPPEQKTEVPKEYDLKLPEKSLLDPAHVEKVKSFAKEAGLSQEQAQKIVDRDNAAVADYQQRIELQKTEWIKTASTDPEIGGEEFAKNAELAKRVMSRFGSEGFKKQLNETGLGNHPELVRTFVRIGRLMSEDQFIFPGGAPQTDKQSQSIEEKFYGPKKEASAS